MISDPIDTLTDYAHAVRTEGSPRALENVKTVDRIPPAIGAMRSGTEDLRGMTVVVVDGVDTVLMHRSVLDRVTEVAFRLGCHGATLLGGRQISLSGTQVSRLRRDLDQVMALADAAQCTGWKLGELAAAPADEPVPALDTPRGMIWVDSAHGFELRGTGGGPQRITMWERLSGTARRVPLSRLIAPLSGAATCARDLEIHSVTREP